MSDSMRPHRHQPTRLPCPWDSPGKNTGVGCHFLIQCRKVKSESEVTQLCLTLHDPMDCSPPGSSIHGVFPARVVEWGVIAFSGIYIYMYNSVLYIYICIKYVWKEVWKKIQQDVGSNYLWVWIIDFINFAHLYFLWFLKSPYITI